MIYAYSCPGCENAFDIVKTVSEMARPESCPKCGAESARQFVPSRIHLSKTSVRHAEFNPAFGKVIRNEHHLRDEIAKHEGTTGSKMVEVGNDYGSGTKAIETFRKRKEEEREQSWKDLKVPL